MQPRRYTTTSYVQKENVLIMRLEKEKEKMEGLMRRQKILKRRNIKT